MSYETVSLDRDGRGVATLWLDRAGKHNAMNARMLSDIHAAAQELNTDASVRVVVLAARGRTFCAGGDLDWMRQQFDAAPAERGAQARVLAEMLQALNTLDKPLIGRVHGNCFGGGVGMVSVCDVAIAAEPVQMALTETRLGLIPATIGPYVLARMGEGKARRVFMSGRRFGAAEAREMDLVARVVPLGDLDAAVEAEIAPYLETAPGAVARAKRLARYLGPAITPEVIETSIAELVACWEGEEAPAGIGAFFDKRRPPWQE
ncbi:crotonase/enoyl-CoA hydratase family protein [Pseudooceanicola aestuarii]|uniref:crotonase/enoyl-CoA hydratase family protein n=1 Tax=Pseudooceanicola aestuarii TaxID=2697319 RepID=UPI0013D4C95C|nr:crotonase/enoyl-CoA hydratase family protein [Pseudooceanicola aestuarii]